MRTNERLLKSVLCLIVLGLMTMWIGCSGSTAKQDQQKPAAVPASGGENHKHHADAKSADHPDTAAGLAELSDADRAIAEKQKTCPVTGEPLGEHGKPIKVTVKGQTVFLCCPACESSIKKEPDKYLNKLKGKGAK